MIQAKLFIKTSELEAFDRALFKMQGAIWPESMGHRWTEDIITGYDVTLQASRGEDLIELGREFEKQLQPA